MTQEDIDWVRANEILFRVNHTITPEQRQTIFNIYNRITGENKKTTSCGRCVRSVLNLVYFTYKKTINQ